MVETGEVMQVIGDECEVQFVRSEMCESCGACHRAGDQKMSVMIDNPLKAQVGDIVEISMEPRSLLKASVWAYLLPLAMLTLGSVIGQPLGWALGFSNDIFSALFGLAGVTLSFFCLRRMDKRFKKNKIYSPKMVGIRVKKGERHGE